MKKLMGLVLVAGGIIACHESENVSEFTGNETVYSLQQASEYSVSGTATLKERRDGSTSVIVQLEGTTGNSTFPVHLHLGDIATPKADIAALLSPVLGKSGRSETVLSRLADETSITYAELIKLNASMKVHLSDVGAERNVILAGGNIGTAAIANPGGRVGFAVCKSE